MTSDYIELDIKTFSDDKVLMNLIKWSMLKVLACYQVKFLSGVGFFFVVVVLVGGSVVTAKIMNQLTENQLALFMCYFGIESWNLLSWKGPIRIKSNSLLLAGLSNTKSYD